MVNLIPFNQRNTDLFSAGIDSFHNMLEDFFADRWPMRRLDWDTFKIDVQENDKEYIIEAELPGVQKNELQVVLDADKLKIAVNKEESVEKEKKNYIHKERRYSSMSRSIFLADADPQGIRAKLTDGLLTIHVTKKTQPDNSVVVDID